MNELPAIIILIIALSAIGLAIAAIIMPVMVIIIASRAYRCMVALQNIERAIRLYR